MGLWLLHQQILIGCCRSCSLQEGGTTEKTWTTSTKNIDVCVCDVEKCRLPGTDMHRLMAARLSLGCCHVHCSCTPAGTTTQIEFCQFASMLTALPLAMCCAIHSILAYRRKLPDLEPPGLTSTSEHVTVKRNRGTPLGESQNPCVSMHRCLITHLAYLSPCVSLPQLGGNQAQQGP